MVVVAVSVMSSRVEVGSETSVVCMQVGVKSKQIREEAVQRGLYSCYVLRSVYKSESGRLVLGVVS